MTNIKNSPAIVAFTLVSVIMTLPSRALDKPGSQRWIQSQLATYPELKWFNSARTEVSQPPKRREAPRYSSNIFGAAKDGFDQAMLSLEVGHRLLEGRRSNYVWLTQSQGKAEKLSWKTYQRLTALVQRIIKSEFD